jgi:hypothetical protein
MRDGSETLLFVICHRSFASPQGATWVVAAAEQTWARLSRTSPALAPESSSSLSYTLVTLASHTLSFLSCIRYQILAVLP